MITRLRHHFPALIVAGLLAVMAGVASIGPAWAQDRQAPAEADRTQPNIVLILADDLDLLLGTIDTMPHLQALMVDQGLTLSDFLVSRTLCCPSRVTILRGQYVHTHTIYGNLPPDGGFQKVISESLESETVATALQGSGYRTVLLGKYLNGYPEEDNLTYIPPGWDEWYAAAGGDPYTNFDYTLNENGQLIAYGSDAEDYMTDVLAARATNFITRTATGGQPFFMYLATYAPHSPATPAPRHEDLFPDATAPQPPSFNEADVSDKPTFLRGRLPLTTAELWQVNRAYRTKLQSMQPVDEMIADLVQTLADTGQLDNTYILFTSDNGLHLGEHRMVSGKGTAYEEDMRVPLIVRGPGVPAGTARPHLAGNVDLAPTFVELAGTALPFVPDGRSLVPLLGPAAPPVEAWRQAFIHEGYQFASDPDQVRLGGRWATVLEPADEDQLIQEDEVPAARFGLRTNEYKYVEYTNGEREFYDLTNDPCELQNVVNWVDPAVLDQLSDWLQALRTCSGAACRVEEDRPAPEYRPAAWTALSQGGGDQLGYAVGAAGDVNGDGYGDVLVGAQGYSTSTGQVVLYYGESGGLAALPATSLPGENEGDLFGSAVAAAGDVNGDGYADVIVGARAADRNRGRATVYLGCAAGLEATPVLTVSGTVAGDQAGLAVATAGDVNGDGYADLVVGVPGYDSGRGRAYVYLGSASGPGAAPPIVLSGEAGEGLGASVGTAGDVNGDGYADVVIGADRYDGDTGRAYVYLGQSAGLDTTPAAILSGEKPNSRFGRSTGTAGDVNGDGYADVVMGAPGYASKTGRIYVYAGGAAGLSATPAYTATGETANSQFGSAVGTAGDVNGDGYADVVIGAPGYDSFTGRIYVYLGSDAGVQAMPALFVSGTGTSQYFGFAAQTAGDVSGDGFSDLVIGAYGYANGAGQASVILGRAGIIGTAPAAILIGATGGDQFGASASTAGDTNGDGYADVLIGAPGYGGGTGYARLYEGQAVGLGATAALTLTGESPADHFGQALSTAGDVNGDGYGDVIAGAPGYRGETGRAYIYLSADHGLSPTPALTLTGRARGDLLGQAVAAAGDVNGDGYEDFVIGAPGVLTGTGQAYVYLGSSAGMNATPAYTLTGAAPGDELGLSAAAAGDVNGDGYADVVIGAPGAVTGTGQATVWLGSAHGLGTTPALVLSGQTAGERFGLPVAAAGDMNGDGYGDVLVGAAEYLSDTGRVAVYAGGPAGLSTAPLVILTGESGGRYGYSAATAGDINGDGYSDVVISDPGSGRAFLYVGRSGNFDPFPALALVLTQADAATLGGAVAAAGDVNGDGYADVVMGTGHSRAGAEEEAAYLYAGNASVGRSLRLRQLRGDGSTPIAPGGWSDSETAFYLALLGRTPFGRGGVKLEWEVKPWGTPFDGSGLQQSAAWMDSGTAGAPIAEPVDGLAIGTAYHWRVRLRYRPATAPIQLHGRWLSLPWHGRNEPDVRTRPASLQLAADAYSAAESAPGVSLTVTLSAVMGVTVTADYAAGGGTATAGSDYMPTAGVVTFAPGITTQLLIVPLIDDSRDEPTETLTITLSSPGHAVLGSPAQASVGIVDDDVLDLSASAKLASRQLVHPGDRLTYTVAISNSGDATAVAAILDPIPAGVGVLTSTLQGGATYDALTNRVEYSGTLLSNASHEIAFQVQVGSVVSGTVITNAAHIGDGTWITVTRQVAVKTVDAPIAVLAATDDSPTAVGRATTLTATVTAGSNVSYTWDLGDAQTAVGAIVQHRYPIGYFTAVATAANGAGSVTASTTITVDRIIGGLSAANDGPTVLGERTALTATIGSGSHVSFTWALGDGETGHGATVKHVYPSAGTYTAVVTAANSVSLVTATTTVTVTNLAPVADAGPDQDVLVGDVVVLDGHGSADPDGHVPLSYGWAQTAGLPVALDNPAAVRPAFAAPDVPATLTFTLAVTDAFGLPDPTPDVCVVRAKDVPIGGLSGANDGPTVLGERTALTATIASGSHVSFTWAFGDGGTGHRATVNHIYPAAGMYTAVVTAANSASLATATTTVRVLEPVRYVYLPLVVKAYCGPAERGVGLAKRR